MVGHDQDIKINPTYYQEAKNFFAFLQAVGRKYDRPTKVNYRYQKSGRFSVIVDGSPGGVDAFFQELILNRGLYYYCCSLRNNKKQEIIRNVIVPIFRELLERRFENPYSRFLRRHVLGKIPQNKFVPGEFIEPFSHDYEVLFRKWDVGIINDWNFIKDLDSFLTRFMLVMIDHPSGKRSPKFQVLVKKVLERGVGMVKDTGELFKKIHYERTKGLHRLKNDFQKDKISNIAVKIYFYFEYFDEFQESQKQKTIKIGDKVFRRIKYGNEEWIDEKGKVLKIPKRPCDDCAAAIGQYHVLGCDIEQCPKCKGQLLSCDYDVEY